MKKIIKPGILVVLFWIASEANLQAQTEIAIPNADGTQELAVFRHSREEHYFLNEAGGQLLGIGEYGSVVLPNIEFDGDIDGLEGDFTVYGYSGTGELIVDISEFPDYVFDENYELMRLEETETYIDQNGHLPGIPAADEFKEGMEMKKFDLKLLEKVEELTLHTISQQKRLEAIQGKLDKLVNRN